MADSDSILDALRDDILLIIQECHTHTVSIAVKCLAKPESEYWTFKRPEVKRATPDQQKAFSYDVSDNGNNSFLIASITKVLVAIAFTMAAADKGGNLEEGAKLDEDSHHKDFKDAQDGDDGLTTVYNKHKDPTKPAMVDLPGDPSISHLLSHFKGLPPSNHLLFAPDGSGLMSVDDVIAYAIYLNNLPGQKKLKTDSWALYSNLNYALIGMTIEVLSRGTLSDFMDNTLFKPLGIVNRTSIGYRENSDLTPAGRYVVDSQGTLHSVNGPNYISSGAEAAALGGYSCIADLDKIFTALLERFATPGPDNKEFITNARRERIRHTEDIEYTRIGLYTAGLDSPTIGSMSTNRLMFPDQKFTTYPIALRSKCMVETYYHAGSAIGCGCAYALLPNKDPERAFFVVVLTNTSGPVDASDHILKLILRHIYFMLWPAGKLDNMRLKLGGLKDINKMVKKSWDASSNVWKQFEKEDAAEGLNISTDISGTYRLKGFPQRLEVHTVNGKPYIIFRGSVRSSKQLRLAWTSNNMVRVCVPESEEPPLAIDRLGEGDWADLTFRVEMVDGIAVALVRNTKLGEGRFERE